MHARRAWSAAALAAPVVVTAVARTRRWMGTWGSTGAERAAPLPGDGLVSQPLATVTRAVSLTAPVEELWPWIAQIGSSALGRGGWHSYDRLDNGGVPSADHVRHDVPAPRVGDVLVPDPAFAWTDRQGVRDRVSRQGQPADPVVPGAERRVRRPNRC